MFGGREEYLEVLGAVFRKNKDAGAGGTQATAGKARVAEMEGRRERRGLNEAEDKAGPGDPGLLGRPH